MKNLNRLARTPLSLDEVPDLLRVSKVKPKLTEQKTNAE